MGTAAHSEFSTFFGDVEQRLRLSLVAAFGPEVGREAAAEAFAWGWQHWDRLRQMDNAVGYLYRVGRSVALRSLNRPVSPVGGAPAAVQSWDLPPFEPQLAGLLAGLPERQRVVVWLVHGMGYRHREVAEVLECSVSSVATHARRALRTLRRGLEVEIDG